MSRIIEWVGRRNCENSPGREGERTDGVGLQISESRGVGEIKIPGGGGLHFARGRDRPGGGLGWGIILLDT